MYDVITGHENIYVNNSSQDRDRAVGEVSLCLSRQDNDLQHDFQMTFWGQDVRDSMRLDEWNTMVFRVFLCLS